MAQRLKLVDRPSKGKPVFVSSLVNEPWGGRGGEVLRVVKNWVAVNFSGGSYEEFLKIVLFELVEED